MDVSIIKLVDPLDFLYIARLSQKLYQLHGVNGCYECGARFFFCYMFTFSGTLCVSLVVILRGNGLLYCLIRPFMALCICTHLQ